jgi:2-methylcitrate dehydratase PrpD
MLVEELARYGVEETRRDLSAAVVHHAKRALVDWFAALIPGASEPPACALAAGLSEDIGRGTARLYGRFPAGFSIAATQRTAALVNGTASHTVEFDDIFRDAIYHPGCPTIAAALATAQTAERSGIDLLKAIVVGYEISTRIGQAVQPAHYKFWHTTGTVGCFGAAAAAASILRLDAGQTAHALATAGTFAAGLQQAFRSDAMSKPLHAGRAAETGLLAALAAAQGLTGALDILEGAAGFGAAMSGVVDWSVATDGLGSRYNIGAITIKNHGCCGHTFAAIDGVLTLQQRHGLAVDTIERIEIGTYRTALDVTGSRRVTTAFEGKFSLAYVAAASLILGSVRLDAFGPGPLADPRIRGLMDRIELSVDPELDRAFPKRRSARVVIITRDGSRFEHLQEHRKGDPELPLDDRELDAKFIELAGPSLGAGETQALLASVRAIDQAADVRLPLTRSEPVPLRA